MFDVKESFLTLSQALRKVYEAKRKKLDTLPQLEEAYKELKKDYPKWLVRDVERFVEKLYHVHKPQKVQAAPEPQEPVAEQETK